MKTLKKTSAYHADRRSGLCCRPAVETSLNADTNSHAQGHTCHPSGQTPKQTLTADTYKHNLTSKTHMLTHAHTHGRAPFTVKRVLNESGPPCAGWKLLTQAWTPVSRSMQFAKKVKNN